MPHFEQTLSSETLFEGRVIRVTLDKVRLENGRHLYARSGASPRRRPALQRWTKTAISIWFANTAMRQIRS